MRATNLETFLTKGWKKRYWYKEWDKIFIQCTHCKKVKELNSDNFYKNKMWYLWYNSFCIDCHKDKMSKANCRTDKQYNINYYNNHKDKLKEYSKKYSKTNKWKEVHKNSRDMKKHWIRQKTQKYIKEKWLRPSVCPICNKAWLVQAHHIDYDEWNKIIFCCQSCHSKIHSWVIKDYKVIDILSKEI